MERNGWTVCSGMGGHYAAEYAIAFDKLKQDTKELRKLQNFATKLDSAINEKKKIIEDKKDEIASKYKNISEMEKQIHALMSELDLYSRIDEFTANGQFETPEYLYETSSRFAEEIKRVRSKQKELISKKKAIIYPDTLTIIPNDKLSEKKILTGQIKLMLSSFNIKCDFLIGKIRPSNYARTLEQVEKLAATLEKSAATLHCGFNLDYIKLKFEECTLQYQFKLKKQEEQEEKHLIREQMREEQKAIREYNKALAQAEEEQCIYKDLLEKAHKQYELATKEERESAKQRIIELENLLAVAEAKGQRAKSMAEQTRRGHVYVLSNIGSFGENIYKIGLTRRIDPELRVKELGDASVPFTFDVHAMIYAEDAPTIEASLHREFKDYRVNSVNFRKEYFKVNIEKIKKAIEKLTDGKAEFKMTARAEQYYESRRLRRDAMGG